MRADHRADLGDAVQKKRRGDGPRIAESHAARIRGEEPQSRKPDSRTVQNRTVQRKARPHPPQNHSRQYNCNPQSPTPVGRGLRARRPSARNPPPRANLQSHHEQSCPRLGQEQHREQTARQDAPEPPPPTPAQRQQRTDQRRRVIWILKSE